MGVPQESAALAIAKLKAKNKELEQDLERSWQTSFLPALTEEIERAFSNLPNSSTKDYIFGTGMLSSSTSHWFEEMRKHIIEKLGGAGIICSDFRGFMGEVSFRLPFHNPKFSDTELGNILRAAVVRGRNKLVEGYALSLFKAMTEAVAVAPDIDLRDPSKGVRVDLAGCYTRYDIRSCLDDVLARALYIQFTHFAKSGYRVTVSRRADKTYSFLTIYLGAPSISARPASTLTHAYAPTVASARVSGSVPSYGLTYVPTVVFTYGSSSAASHTIAGMVPVPRY